jgi:hypothetical protein
VFKIKKGAPAWVLPLYFEPSKNTHKIIGFPMKNKVFLIYSVLALFGINWPFYAKTQPKTQPFGVPVINISKKEYLLQLLACFIAGLAAHSLFF